MPELEYLAQALQADAIEREALWAAATEAKGKDERHPLRIALLRSIPGHSGYAPGEAHRQLKAFRHSGGTPEAIAIAAIRLAALQAAWTCEEQIDGLQAEVSALEENLIRITDIERELETDGDDE